MRDNEYGHIEIMLDQVLQKRDITRTKLMYRSEMQWRQLNAYIEGTIQRLDIDVLCRLCYVLECDISDIVKYIPGKSQE